FCLSLSRPRPPTSTLFPYTTLFRSSVKLRELFVRPHAGDHTFFYGVNFEFSYNASYWESRHFTSEIRPIIGLHLHPWDIIINPRSEEHTSELQSRGHLVCRLLLEKK